MKQVFPIKQLAEGRQVGYLTFSSHEDVILSVSTKNQDLWPVPMPEDLDSRTFHQI